MPREGERLDRVVAPLVEAIRAEPKARAAEIRARKGPHPAEHVERECAYCLAVLSERSVPTEPMSRQDVPTLCATCHKAPREGRNRQCFACRKAAYREGKA